MFLFSFSFGLIYLLISVLFPPFSSNNLSNFSLLNIAPFSFVSVFLKKKSNFEMVLPNRAPFMGLILIYMAAEHRQRAEEKEGKNLER